MGDLSLEAVSFSTMSSLVVKARVDLHPEHVLSLPNKVTGFLNSPEAVMPARDS